MSINKLFKILLAGTIALPITFSVYGVANAQKVLSRQNIVKSLQQKSRKRQTQRVTNRNSRQKSRATKRRASSRNNNQRSRPPSSQTANTFRAPSRAPKARPPAARAPRQDLAKRRAPIRAPARAPRSRAPQAHDQATLQFRAPGRAPTRTPRARAPQQNANNAIRVPNRPPRARAPQQNFNSPAQRAPNRNPQRFNEQFASTDNFDNGRAIRIEQQQRFPDLNNASVDLEILFEYNSARISRESVRQLIILGEALHDVSLSESRILIAGHTDAAGSRGYNNELSFRRAQSVSDFLVNYAGIAAGRLYTDGYGEDRLKYPDAPNSGQNRRVEIINMGR